MPLRSPAAESRTLRRAQPLLGTLVDIEVQVPDDDGRWHQAISGAFEVMARIHALMSFHDEQSELTRLNREALRGPVLVDPHTLAVFEAALRFARMSRGAFDPCVAPRLESWGLLPGRGDCDATATWRDIECDEGTIRYHRALHVDLGGIAKGYAVDLAVEHLGALGVPAMMVNAGGDVRVLGCTRSVWLRDPSAPTRLAMPMKLRDSALATSAAYFSKSTHGKQSMSALVDPQNGVPFVGEGCVSVSARNCLEADALTKVVLFAAPPIAEACLAACNAEAIFLQ
jgi:thiamine biosynthesis lipoprotein